MTCPYCGAGVGDNGICAKCGPPAGTAMTGWRPDPTARHEGRYYVAGRPTDRVRDGRAQASDPGGGRLLPDYVALPARSRTSIRSTWLATGAATVVIVLLGAVLWGVLLHRHRQPSPDAEYLAALRNAGLGGEFTSDATALAHGRQVCRQLDEGGPQQGVAADKIAVDVFCRQFAKGFRILETATVQGTFVLTDSEESGSITADQSACAGAGGYSDIGSHTEVSVTNGKREILATTALGQGHGDSATCSFTFSFPVTEGQDRYVVAVGKRGEFSYSFAQLQRDGVAIRLGH